MALYTVETLWDLGLQPALEWQQRLLDLEAHRFGATRTPRVYASYGREEWIRQNKGLTRTSEAIAFYRADVARFRGLYFAILNGESTPAV